MRRRSEANESEKENLNFIENFHFNRKRRCFTTVFMENKIKFAVEMADGDVSRRLRIEIETGEGRDV
jgi:hypothetical protein